MLVTLDMIHDLSRKMKISLKKQIWENTVNHQIHQILLINSKNDKTEYHGRTYAKNEVVIEPGLISNNFEFREPEFYKLVKMCTCDDDSQTVYTVPVGRYNKQTSVEESKYTIIGIITFYIVLISIIHIMSQR